MCPRPSLLFVVLMATVASALVAAQVADDYEALDDDGDYEDDLLDDAEDDYDMEEEDEDDLYWDDEDVLEEEWELLPNITADELDVLSGVADYLSSVHHLLGDATGDKERRRAEGVLDDAFGPVKRDVVALVAAAALLPGAGPPVVQCIQNEEQRARDTLQALEIQLESCYRQASPSLDPPASPSPDDADDAAEQEEEEVQREARDFLALALGVMRLTPLAGAAEVAEMAEAEPHSFTFAQHAEMLQRRERRRRARVARCVDLHLEDAYRHADAAREGLASCLLLLGQPPPGVDPAPPHDEL